MIEILLHANDPAVLQFREGRERISGRGIAGPSACRCFREDQEPFAEVHEFHAPQHNLPPAIPSATSTDLRNPSKPR
jgi:hypothetical protein